MYELKFRYQTQIYSVSDANIKVQFTKPNVTTEKTKLVVLVHGFAGDRNENGFFTTIASELARAGLIAARYDCRGTGESTGSYAKSSVKQHAEDLKVIIKSLTQAGTIAFDPQQISLIGFSLGAAIVGTALKDGLQASKVSYLAPATRPNKSMWPRYDTEQFRTAIEEDREVQKPGSQILLGKSILESIRDTDLGENSFELTKPLLVIHGTEDTRIDIAYSDQAVKKNKISGVEYHRIEGATHSFRPPEQNWQVVAQTLTKWFLQ